MVDPDAVRRRLREIDRRLTALEEVRDRGMETFLGDAHLQAEGERHLQLALQAMIDVANHILAEDFPQTPESYAAALELLGKNGVLETELAERLADAAKVRNILVHSYLEVDHERLWRALESLDDLRRFSAAVVGYLGD